MAKRLHKTLLDYLVIAISPALIIVLVNSLAQFLIEVFYRGNFQGRLGFVFTMFVIGAVLIGRISIEEGRERAVLFAVPLGIAILLAIGKFVQFQGMLAPFNFPINCGLIALLWWSADKLVWDCTLIDEQEEDSGEGLLETVNLDRPDHAVLRREIAPVPEPEATTSRGDVPTSWWDRFVERRRRPHAPGVWVIYFSLAALPLFGVGQLFIPQGNLLARQEAFRHLLAYTASGLGLLLSTSFLGLRRYLRQRQQEMPMMMVNLWLGIGAALIVGVMFVALLLPRPNAEYAISEVPISIGSPDQKASPYGVGSEGVEEDRPDARGEARADAKPDQPQSDQSSDIASAEKKASGDDRAGQSKDRQGSSETRNDKFGQVRDDSKRPARQPDEAGHRRTVNDQAKSTRPGGAAEKPTGSAPPKRLSSDRSGTTLGTRAMPRLSFPTGGDFLAAAFKWIFYIVAGGLLAYFAWTRRAEILAALRDFCQTLADFWNRLFGHVPGGPEENAEQQDVQGSSLRRFADFADPFAAGVAGRYRPEELVRYTFEALEAWARDNGHPRLPEQTPHEFARSLGAATSSLADGARHLADLYSVVAYAPRSIKASSVASLSRLWRDMRSASAVVAAGQPQD